MMSFADRVHQLQSLLLSFHPIIAIETVEEERVQTLLQKATQEMQMPLFEWSITQGLTRSQGPGNRWVDECAPASDRKAAAFENTTEPLSVLQTLLELPNKAVFWMKDFAKHLEDPLVARQLREVAQVFSKKVSALILSGDAIALPGEIAHDAVFLELKLPERDELQQVVTEVIRALTTKNRVQVQLEDSEMQTLVQALRGMTLKQARQVIAYAALVDGKLTFQDVQRILQRKAQVIREGGLLEYLPAPKNQVELGGFAGLKRWLVRARVGFSPQAQALNLRSPRGILIVGMQGTGKSLAAKAIAQEWQLPLLKLDTGRLYDKYVGESEKNLRQAIVLAESMAPTVLWIDEIEKSLGNNDTDTDGGVSRRLFGFFLTWMQEKSQEVFVVATANDISRIPPELLRKGRFDEIFFVDLPAAQERAAILNIHLTRHQQSVQTFDLAALVTATEGFSGAEIEQAVIAALYHALYLNQPLETPLLLQEIKAIIPLSVSRREDLQQLRELARTRFVSVR